MATSPMSSFTEIELMHRFFNPNNFPIPLFSRINSVILFPLAFSDIVFALLFGDIKVQNICQKRLCKMLIYSDYQLNNVILYFDKIKQNKGLTRLGLQQK
jgi:hypothetical protein